MDIWTFQDDRNKLPNINVKHCYLDGVLIMFELYPEEGYVLHVPSGDEYALDDKGNPTDEIIPYYTGGGATEFPNYDWEANPENYHADLYEEGMIVFGSSNHETI